MSKRLGVFSLITATVVNELRRVHAALEFDSTDVEKDASGVPVAFRMWRAGVNPTDHGDHVLTPRSVATLLAAQLERGNLFSVDVDHMSLDPKAPPENHKAVGWFTIEDRNGDLWATNVQWTDAVRAGLAKDPPEWRYFSPAYDTKKDSGEIVRLLNLALTNNPATHHVTALASATGGSNMDDYEKMTLAALLAAIDDEKDEGKKSAMQKCARAKMKAALDGDGDNDGDPKKDPPAPEKKETKADEPPPEKKETTKADAADGDPKKEEAKIAASIADRALVEFEQKRKARDEKIEIERILARLPAGDRETYKDFTLPQLERILKRHHANVLQDRAAASTAMPVRGATQTAQHRGGLPPTERANLDSAMGLNAMGGWLVREVGTTLEFNGYATAKDAKRVLEMVEAEQKNVIAEHKASMGAGEVLNREGTRAEAFARVLANNGGIV